MDRDYQEHLVDLVDRSLPLGDLVVLAPQVDQDYQDYQEDPVGLPNQSPRVLLVFHLDKNLLEYNLYQLLNNFLVFEY